MHIVAGTIRNELEDLTELEWICPIVDKQEAGNADNDAGDMRGRRLSVKGGHLVLDFGEWE